MSKDETEFLVRRARKKDTDAFSELIQMYSADMYKVAYAILLNNEDSADAIQDAIFACWQTIDSLKNVRYFKTWMTRILINKCYDILSLRKREVVSEDREESSVENSYNVEFEEALQSIDEKYRAVIVLYYSEGYGIREIASLLDLPANTVSTRLRRGREKLKEYYILGGIYYEE